MTTAFLATQLTGLETVANEYLRVITALLSRDGVQSYELDTGQGRQRVTAADLPELQTTYGCLISQIQTMSHCVNGTGATHGRPLN